MEEKNVSGDEDKILTDVPISFAALHRLKVDDSENMDRQHKVDHGNAIMTDPTFIAPHADVLLNMDKQHKVDHGDAIMAVPISFMAPQDDALLQHKIDEDKDAILVDVPRSFIAPDESKVEALEHQVNDDEDATLMDIPISFIGFEESKADVFKQHKIDEDKDVVLVDVPISFIEPDESNAGALVHEVNDDKDATLIEVPISFIGFEESKADVFENEMIPKNMHYLHTHTFEQRRKNWIIKNTSRRDGSTMDYVYHHLETNKKFRSLVEVYKFVVDGEVRETKKKFNEYGETLQVTPKGKPRVRGNKLIKHYVVGTCTESSNGIYIKNRGEVNYLREMPSNIERKRKRENEDLYGHQQVNLGDDATRLNLGDATLSTPIQSFLYLWDFELIQQKQKPVEMFPIPNNEDSKGKDSSIDLLSSLPKATGKRPYEEDEARKESKKRKNMKRGQEQTDILEAQRRSRVDEELRLDELRAHAGGTSSSVLPTQVNMISGINVAMKSQTLTVTPPTPEGTPEVSLSVPSTTETTVDSFGAGEAPSLFPDSEA